MIELQHSPISVEKIAERERFYRQHGSLVWVFDVRDCEDQIMFRPSKFKSNEFFCIWKWARKSLQRATCPVYLDLFGGDEPLLKIVKWARRKDDLPQAFVARYVERDDFIYRFMLKVPSNQSVLEQAAS